MIAGLPATIVMPLIIYIAFKHSFHLTVAILLGVIDWGFFLIIQNYITEFFVSRNDKITYETKHFTATKRGDTSGIDGLKLLKKDSFQYDRESLLYCPIYQKKLNSIQ